MVAITVHLTTTVAVAVVTITVAVLPDTEDIATTDLHLKNKNVKALWFRKRKQRAFCV